MIIGAVDPRLPVRMEQFGDDTHPTLVAETSRYRVYQVRWPVLEGFFGNGLLVLRQLPADMPLPVCPQPRSLFDL